MHQLNNKETADISGASSFIEIGNITLDEFKALWKGPLVENKAEYFPLVPVPRPTEFGLPVEKIIRG
jgi:hypothetical protein